MSRRVTPLLAFCALALLSGCGMFGGKGDAPVAAASTCPAASILKPLQQTAIFAPGAPRQPLGVSFYGVLADATVTCEGAGAAVDVVVIAERGPAAGGGTAVDVQYFVATTGPNQQILSKQSYPVHIDIAANAKRGGVTDHLVLGIPAVPGGPGSVNIVVGFQQSPEVVEFYKHFRGR